MNLPEPARDILVALLDRGGDDEHPLILSRQELANATGVVTRTLDRHLAILRSLGFIRWEWTQTYNRFIVSRNAANQVRIYREYKRKSEDMP